MLICVGVVLFWESCVELHGWQMKSVCCLCIQIIVWIVVLICVGGGDCTGRCVLIGVRAVEPSNPLSVQSSLYKQ